MNFPGNGCELCLLIFAAFIAVCIIDGYYGRCAPRGLRRRMGK